MSQKIHINLDGGELPCTMLLAPGIKLVKADPAEIEVALLEGGMESGKHSVAVFARVENEVVMIEMSAASLLNIAGAVRGRLTALGVIPTAMNPALVFSADKKNKCVHFSAEAPLMTWAYTLPHAKAFWRQLKAITEEAGQ